MAAIMALMVVVSCVLMLECLVLSCIEYSWASCLLRKADAIQRQLERMNRAL